MDISKLRPAKGATHARKRIGRGNASGQGTYAGKGLKGQKARSGPMPYPGFEGGQWPLVRKIAKRGFTNPFKVIYEEVKVSDLAAFAAGSEVGPEALIAAGIVKRPRRPVKVLSNGELDHALTVRVHKATAQARQKIEAAGGTVQLIGGETAAAADAGADGGSSDEVTA